MEFKVPFKEVISSLFQNHILVKIKNGFALCYPKYFQFKITATLSWNLFPINLNPNSIEIELEV